MSFRVEQKIGNTTYVYESTGYWDKEKKQSRHKRVCIGKIDPETGETVACRKKKKTVTAKNSKMYGSVYLLNEIAGKLNLIKVLEEIFPGQYKEILMCAFFSIIESKALHLAEIWADDIAFYDDAQLSSQRISELLRDITKERQLDFFRSWGRQKKEDEYLALDITSISSYSSLIEAVDYGYNRDREKLPQINLAMIVGETTGTPVYFNEYPGSIKDVTTLKNILKTIGFIKLKKVKFVMDKGFYKTDHIDELLRLKMTFIIAVPFTKKITLDLINRSNDIRNTDYSFSLNNDTLQGKSYAENQGGYKITYHVYFNEKRYAQEKDKKLKEILKLEDKIQNNADYKKGSNSGEKYFNITDKNGILVCKRNNDEIKNALQKMGYLVIVTNENSLSPKEVLDIYRTKDRVEQTFDNLKGEDDLNRLNVQSDMAVSGKLFINFIALILENHIYRTMRDEGLFKDFTLKKLLMELRKLKKIDMGTDKILTEITPKQKKIFKIFGIRNPD